MARLHTRLLIAFIAFAAFTESPVARAQSASPSPKFPAKPNALLTVDVAKILQSRMARQLDWQSKLIKGQADRPLAIPGSTKRLTVGAALNPAGMQSIWQAAIIELPSLPRLESIIRTQGGYLDSINGKNAVWSPKDVYYVALNDNTLGVVQPGQRQYVSRWVSGATSVELPDYLEAARKANRGADALFAVDLQDMVSVAGIRYAYAMGDLPSLEKTSADRDKLIAALARVKGFSLSMLVSDKIVGNLTVDFAGDVSELGDAAEPFAVDVLKAVSLYEPGIQERWTFKAKGTQIVGEGEMVPNTFSELMALLSPAVELQEDGGNAPAAAAPKAGTETAPPAAAEVPDAVTASKKYYKVISGLLDNLSPKQSPKQGGTWLVSKARVIDQMPILNVDPDLVVWGSSISEGFNRAAQELVIGQQKAVLAAANVASPTGEATYTETGYGTQDTAQSRAAFRNAQQARTQAAQTERGAGGERALNILQQLVASRPKIRAHLTQKYGVEF